MTKNRKKEDKSMNSFRKLKCLLILTVGILLFSSSALATEYSPAYRVKSSGDVTGIGYNEVAATLHLSGNSDIKGVAETGAAYNYLGIETSNGNNFEIGLTKDKHDLENGRWSVFAYANYEGAFSYYGTEGRWVNFRRDGASFAGPQMIAADGSIVAISLKVLEKDEVVFEVSGYEPVRIRMPGADPQGEKQIFRRVTSLMTDDPQGFFKNTRWSSVKIKKGNEPYSDWTPRPADISQSNNMDKNDPHSSWVSVLMDNENVQTIDIIMDRLSGENGPYAYEIQSKTDETMRVQFVGNQMFHNDRYLGFGVSGKPMLSLRYMAERFGFRVDYDPQAGTSLLSKGQYSFRLKPGSNRAEIFWAGNKLKEIELTAKPLIRNNMLYLYSLDISDLLGLITYWDNSTRTWDVLYREYTYQERAFPTAINGDLLMIKGVLFDDGQHDMPALQIMDSTDEVRPYFNSVSLCEFGIDSKQHKYEMDSSFKLQKEINHLQVNLTIGQRILFAKNIEVVVDIEAKEIVVNPPYQLTSPTKGYVKVSQPQFLISGSAAGINNNYPAEVVLFVKKADQEVVLLKESEPIIDGQFKHELKLKNGEGLYKVTVNSVMAGPHGPVYPEITDFYVEYHK